MADRSKAESLNMLESVVAMDDWQPAEVSSVKPLRPTRTLVHRITIMGHCSGTLFKSKLPVIRVDRINPGFCCARDETIKVLALLAPGAVSWAGIIELV